MPTTLKETVDKMTQDEYQKYVQDSILAGYRDYAEGRYIISSGNLLEDIKNYRAKKAL